MKIIHEQDGSITLDGENCFIIQDSNKLRAQLTMIDSDKEYATKMTIQNFSFSGYYNRKDAILKTLEHHGYSGLRKRIIKMFL